VLRALTRAVPPTLARCELTHQEREPIDVALAAAQHERYEQALAALGCTVERLPPEPELPDSVFVEDVAVVLDEAAVVTRPGAASRRPETASVIEALRAYRDLVRVEPPGTLEGGDVLRLGSVVYVGLSTRSNAVGIEQLRTLLRPLGYEVRAVAMRGCLHLKTAVTLAADGTLLLNPAWVDPAAFPGFDHVAVDPAEAAAANVLRVGGEVIIPAHHPRTRERLESRGIVTRPVDVSELAKAEAGVTCCSLIFDA
jgi:dimethylargininase